MFRNSSTEASDSRNLFFRKTTRPRGAGFGVSAVACLCALSLIFSGCASRNDEPADAMDNGDEPVIELMGKRTFPFDMNRAPFVMFEQYEMSPGDVLDVLYHVNTWKVGEGEEFRIAIDHTISVKFVDRPELNETQNVRPDGKISLPYLGSVKVTGMTVEELTKKLKDQYSEFMKSPELYVTVPEFRMVLREFKRDLHTAPRGLSRLVTVRPDGYATFAMLGDILVAGRSIPEVNKEMNDRYADIMPGMSVDLFLEKHAGSVIYVLGEVERPNAYPIVRYTSIVEALSLAEGALPSANLEQVVVVRRKGDKMAAMRLNVKDTLRMKAGSSFFYLRPDDIVFVPRRRLTRWADVAREISDVLFFRGWGVGIDYDLGASVGDYND